MKCIPLPNCNKLKLQEWIDKSNHILAEMIAEPDAKRRRAIIHRNKKHWRDHDLLSFLSSLSDGKCWYSEAKFTAEYPHLEHFRPKSCARNENWEKCHEGYWWLAFDLGNYRLSKPVPNTKKGTYFPLRERAQAVSEPGIAVTRESPFFLDPTNEEDVCLLSFNALGKVEPCAMPAVELDEWDKTRIAFTVKRYGLENPTLCDQRKALWISITSLFDEYAYYGLKVKRERCIESAGRIKQIRQDLAKLLEPTAEFTGVVRDCFKNNKVGLALYPDLVASIQNAA